MGYTSSGGTKGRGSFNNSPGTTADLNQLLALINAYGNYAGGITEAARDAITGDALYEGLMIWNSDAAAFEFYDGTGWQRAVPFIQAGTVTTTSEPTTSRQGLVFTFPEPFAAIPTLMVTGFISTSGNRVVAVTAVAATSATQGGLYYAADANFAATAQATFSWVAFGVKA